MAVDHSNDRRRSRAKRFALGLCALLLVTSCDLFHVEKPPAPPRVLALQDEGLQVLLDPSLPCLERMKEVAYRLECQFQLSALGREAVCALVEPYEQLTFGCGVDEELAPRERLRLTPKGPAGREALTDKSRAAFGPCRLETRADGRAFCFFEVAGMTSGLRTFQGGSLEFPTGLYLEYGDSIPAARPRAEAQLLPGSSLRALVLSSELLSAEELARVPELLASILAFGTPAPD